MTDIEKGRRLWREYCEAWKTARASDESGNLTVLTAASNALRCWLIRPDGDPALPGLLDELERLRNPWRPIDTPGGAGESCILRTTRGELAIAKWVKSGAAIINGDKWSHAQLHYYDHFMPIPAAPEGSEL